MEISIEKNFIAQEDAQKFIDVINNMKLVDPEVQERRVLRFGYDAFNGNAGSIEKEKDILKLLKPYVKKIEDLINSNFNHSKKVWGSTVWISKQVSGVKIMPHIDTDGNKNWQYSHAAIIYLNTQDAGGEIYFPKINIELKPSVGDMIYFECRSMESKHGVKRTQQERYAIPIWFTDYEEYKLFKD
jgi:2OG-Fe(II) oxygenase superfamily